MRKVIWLLFWGGCHRPGIGIPVAASFCTFAASVPGRLIFLKIIDALSIEGWQARWRSGRAGRGSGGACSAFISINF